MVRHLTFCLLALTVTAVSSQSTILRAQSGFWYPNCSSGSCYTAPSHYCPQCATNSGMVSVAQPAMSAVPGPMVAPPALPAIPPVPGAHGDPNAPPVPTTPPPAAAQPSPSDAGDSNRDEELEQLRREIQRLQQRNAEYEEMIEELRRATKDDGGQTRLRELDDRQQQLQARVNELNKALRERNDAIERQLESIFDSIARLKPADATDEDTIANVRELRAIIESVPQLIEESVQARVEELAQQQAANEEQLRAQRPARRVDGRNQRTVEPTQPDDRKSNKQPSDKPKKSKPSGGGG